jgi:hypothetical protein
MENTYKITWMLPHIEGARTGDNLIKAKSEEDARFIFNKEYSCQGKKIISVVNCSTVEYQLAYDNEHFDSNGRRRF